ncbi:MAG: hypothetical protein WBD41_00785 [Rhodococcus sp. (in: high G+C Gram-positive bacteria)]|uniref:hypothetical protein n=1 Tax=Rhodococcus sp. EPR-157 TaxID=1813677 RepID=UPI0007BB2D53|nr:hypothetical protein [Rhodococcus sp. EPR-157]KZF07174.1 hypothetical protein A2J03_23290 [Rhodococcus sp. EPR-157]
MTPSGNVIYLADHSVVLALPALVPAFVIVGVVLFVVARDRRAERNEGSASDSESDGADTSNREES